MPRAAALPERVADVDRLVLFALPHAGAGAAVYRDWPGRLPGWIELVPLQPPGRGVRHGEPILADWAVLMAVLMRDIEPYAGRRFAIFGHSMGALAGLELAHAVAARWGTMPLWLGASGCTAPARRKGETKWRDCPAGELLDEVRRLGGTLPELLENTELLELVLPVLRADFHLCGSYRPPVRPPLRCPLLALGGTDDAVSAEPENLDAWSRETTGPFAVEMFAGGHFFIDGWRGAVIGTVVKSLTQAIIRGGQAHA